MALTTAEKNAIADTEAARLLYMSLHTADPSTTGANETTGGSPAYARKALTPGASANGVVAFGEVTFDAVGGTYTHFGLWSASTGGTFRGGGALAASQTLSSQGQVKVTLTETVTVS